MPEHPLELPADDRILSPYTGYTRAHWETTADLLLAAALRYATPGHALIDLPGLPSQSGVRSDGLEGFARTFLLAAFRTAGASGKDPHGFLERYTAGLVRGTRTPAETTPSPGRRSATTGSRASPWWSPHPWRWPCA